MKKVIITASATVAMLFGANAMAFKVGVVDMQKVFSSPNGVSQIQSKLEKEFSSQRSDMMKMMKQIQADQKSLGKNKSVMNAADLAKKQAALKAEQAKFQVVQGKYQQQVMKAQAAAMKTFVTDIKQAANQVAKKDSLDAVFVNNSILYAKDSQDVTSEILADMK